MRILAEFLLARLREDEMGAKHIVPEEHWPSLRSLRDVEAKRRIVECWETRAFEAKTLRILASVYSDHPDYDEAWRP